MVAQSPEPEAHVLNTHGGAYQGKACWTAEKTKGNPMGSLRRTLKEHMLKRTEICRAAPTAKAWGKHEITRQEPFRGRTGEGRQIVRETKGALDGPTRNCT